MVQEYSLCMETLVAIILPYVYYFVPPDYSSGHTRPFYTTVSFPWSEQSETFWSSCLYVYRQHHRSFLLHSFFTFVIMFVCQSQVHRIICVHLCA